MKNIEAIIFDMDGIIVNSTEIWSKCEIDFFKDYAPDITPEIVANIPGMDLRGIYRFLDKEYDLNISEEEFVKIYNNYGIKNIYYKAELIPGVKELICELSKKYDLALASSAPWTWIDIVLERFPLKEYFKVLISGQDDIKGLSKPEPDIYLTVAKKLEVVPKNCLVIEDAKNGVLAAKAAGMTVYGFQNNRIPILQDLSMADKIFTDFKDLLKL